MSHIAEIARILIHREHVFLLGRGQHFVSALLGALNIKEASYCHAEAFSAGELKHGVLALIEEQIPVIVFVEKNDEYMLSVAAQVKSRGAYVIAIGHDDVSDSELFDKFIPMPGPVATSAISSIIPCQLLAYYLAVFKGHNPDRPRNLAKSVTVR